MMYLWQLPQHLLALLVIKIGKADFLLFHEDTLVYAWRKRGAISLGKYIIVPVGSRRRLILHEYGHSIQSKYFGWLYLLIIGVPSILQAMINRFFGTKIRTFPETWADRLGGL